LLILSFKDCCLRLFTGTGPETTGVHLFYQYLPLLVHFSSVRVLITLVY
jgi:hypothetical protein